MKEAKVKKLFLDSFGEYLGMERGCFIIRDKSKNTVEKYPLFEEKIGEIIVKSGNTVSVGALSSCAFWEIDLLVLTRDGKPVGYLRSLEYDSHAETRVAQYRTHTGEKAAEIVRQIVYSKCRSQNVLLKKYGLKPHDILRIKGKLESVESDDLKTVRKRMAGIEGYHTGRYFKQIFTLLPKWIRPERRIPFQAYDGGNNLFNLAYTLLKWKVHIALVRASLEPYLGFVHSLAWSKPSLVLDFQDLYRYLVDNFLIEYCQNLKKSDFKAEFKRKEDKIGKRIFLNNKETRNLVRQLYEYLQKKVEVSRTRRGKKQEIETLINEEAYLFAKYLRDEKKTWDPRIIEEL